MTLILCHIIPLLTIFWDQNQDPHNTILQNHPDNILETWGQMSRNLTYKIINKTDRVSCKPL